MRALAGYRSALVVLALALGGCTSAPRDVHVIVIATDTLRADRLGCYDHLRPTSPRIDALAREGVVFEQAISQSSWTLPAFASIFTGLLRCHHRVGEGKLCLSGACGALGPEPTTPADAEVLHVPLAPHSAV